MERRAFLKTAGGAGAGLIASTNVGQNMELRSADRLPREVWIATLTMEQLKDSTIDKLIDRIIGRMEETLPCQPDIICIPESFVFPGVSHSLPVKEIAEEIPGPIIKRFAAFAKDNKCYVICPLHTKQQGKIFNSAVLIDRKGDVAHVYNKIHPTHSEVEGGTCPGAIEQPVYKTDFGVIGFQICFDANWADGWYSLKQQGAEIIFWPSAFPGGRILNGWAWSAQAHIVTSTWSDPSRIIDITGDEIAATGRYEHWVCAPVNLDKAMIHTWPYTKEIDALRDKYGQTVRVTRKHDEGWTIIESRSADVSIMDALKEFNIPLHREHIARADKTQKQARGL